MQELIVSLITSQLNKYFINIYWHKKNSSISITDICILAANQVEEDTPCCDLEAQFAASTLIKS